MRSLRRNQQQLYYCLLDKTQEQHKYDEYGNDTGEIIPKYGEAQELWANISAARGASQVEAFGDVDNYDKVICTTWMDCPIDENTVLFIDKQPETVTVGDVSLPKYDYVVKRVAKSMNNIMIAVAKVR